MSYASRQSILPSSRQSTLGASGASAHDRQLQIRIAQKRAELENLKQLRDLSGSLANQMTELEKKLATLRDGAETVACVLQNWEGVLGVIGMATSKAATALVPGQDEELDQHKSEEPDLPVTLVRIPVEDPDAEKDQPAG